MSDAPERQTPAFVPQLRGRGCGGLYGPLLQVNTLGPTIESFPSLIRSTRLLVLAKALSLHELPENTEIPIQFW